ncbi:MAG TPA: methenyltetrahydromethanopterin cyclohydrolase [Archaeoglobaceae archaeon]|nr:methenyltetrahydromethanopterin cyclohydrolase [Archaeoglobaceae archaeon]
MISVNEIALDIVEDMMDYEEELRIESYRLDNKATVIDCGVDVKGGYEAGVMFTKVCMGGFCDINITMNSIEDKMMPFITVYTDQPSISCLGSQKAGWKIEVDNYSAIGSGPARALALKPKETYEQIEYEDDSEYAIIALESNKLPNEDVIDYIAGECDVEPRDVYAIVAPTASISGSVQISGRIVETAVYKMAELGYDPKKIISAIGSCPIAPVMSDNLKAMGVTNDSIIYYGSAYVVVPDYDDIFRNVPSSESEDYGKPFYEIFKDAGYDFYSIDKNLFAPAQITFNTVEEGKTYVFGKLNSDVLIKSYQMERF